MSTGSESDLRRLQAWVQSVITHPAGIAAGISLPEANEQLQVSVDNAESIITRSSKQSAIERLKVYGNAYFARLLGCMQDEFPATRRAVGDDAFAAFVSRYLQVHPSTSYSLGDLHRRFPDFLKASRPAVANSATIPDWIDFIIDLASLESTYCDVFDGPGEEQLQRLSVADVSQLRPDQWSDSRLTMAPSLRLLHLRFPVHVYASAVRKGEPPETPQSAEIWLAVHRRDYIVRRRPLTLAQFRLLEALIQGNSISDAIGRALSEAGTDATTLDELQLAALGRQLQSDFRIWVEEGYFVAVT